MVSSAKENEMSNSKVMKERCELSFLLFFGKAHFLSTSWNLVFYYKIALVFLFRAPNNPFYRIQSIVLVKDPQGRSKDQILDLVSGFPQSHSLPMSRFRLSLID